MRDPEPMFATLVHRDDIDPSLKEAVVDLAIAWRDFLPLLPIAVQMSDTIIIIDRLSDNTVGKQESKACPEAFVPLSELRVTNAKHPLAEPSNDKALQI
ncbi:hypothetical protein M407DRAFT_31664 [Tulasnella calospora MUT 4182]|uniref:Uncharacterized protein n=1 Tax=Tulasnella calospora MUT 4182 TaxID=1051891 RepID=A0A0C3PUY4_9AGAM|nr:hypothetical protein M407DRAFT_31664 [Tulasnella calospora MUT 4182]